MTGSEAE
jgi:hypothetical protein